jgi:nitrate/nitrite transport system substrate-binding protein
MHHDTSKSRRRRFLSQTTLGTAGEVAAMSPALRAPVWAAGSDAPEQKDVKIGFIPLLEFLYRRQAMIAAQST